MEVRRRVDVRSTQSVTCGPIIPLNIFQYNILSHLHCPEVSDSTPHLLHISPHLSEEELPAPPQTNQRSSSITGDLLYDPALCCSPQQACGGARRSVEINYFTRVQGQTADSSQKQREVTRSVPCWNHHCMLPYGGPTEVLQSPDGGPTQSSVFLLLRLSVCVAPCRILRLPFVFVPVMLCLTD